MDNLWEDPKYHKVLRFFDLTKNYIEKCDDLVYGITFADPPVPTENEGLIVEPHSWCSSAVDKIKNTEGGLFVGGNEQSFSIVEAGWHETGGVIILFSVSVGGVFCDDEPLNSFCAGTEYVPFFNEYNLEIQSECALTGLEPLYGPEGCNPGGIIHFPYAPKFNEFVLYHRKRDETYIGNYLFSIVPKPTMEIAKEVFSEEGCNLLRKNRVLDTMIEQAINYKEPEANPVKANSNGYSFTFSASSGLTVANSHDNNHGNTLRLPY